MIYIVLNAVPILAATLAGLAAGWGFLLASGAAARRGPGVIATAFVAQAWLAAILAGAIILAPTQAGAWTMALGSAFIIWIGFIVPAIVVTHGYRGLGGRAAAIDCAHWLIVMLVQAAVLRGIGVVPPPA